MKQDYERMFKISREEQLKQLEANEDKDGWDNLSIVDLTAEIDWHLRKLRKVITKKAIKKQFANIANYAGIGLDIVNNWKDEMKFSKDRVFTVVNAEDAKKYIGRRGWFADSIESLAKAVTMGDTTYELTDIYDAANIFRFEADGYSIYNLFYPYEVE
jgi:hypothetical protein